MALAAPTYSGPVNNSINNTAQGNALVQSNQAQAASLGITLPGVGGSLPSQAKDMNKTTEPTVLTSANPSETKIPQNNSTLATYPKAGGLVASDGFVRNADASFAEAPSDAVQNENGQWTSGGLTYAIGPQAGKISSDPAIQSLYDQFGTLKSQMDATGAQNIENIRQQFAALIKEQQQVNAGAEAGTYSLLLRGGSMQTASGGGIQQAQISYGLSKISDLQTKENAAIVAAQMAQQDGDYKLLHEQLSIAQQARSERQAAAQKMSDQIIAAKQKVMDANKAAQKDNAIIQILASGVIDPKEISKKLNDDQSFVDTYGGVTAKEINDAISNMNPDQSNIKTLLTTAAGNQAPNDVLKAIGAAKNYTEALQAAGMYASNATGDLGLYQNYVRQAQAQGQTPVPFESWDAAKKYREAFATAKGTAAGKVAGEGSGGTTGLSQNTIKAKTDIPAPIRPYASQSSNGTWYLDLSGVSSNARAGLIAQAGDLPVLTNANEALDLVNIRDVNAKLKTIANVMKDITSPSALSRDLGGAGMSALSALAQKDPRKAAALALQDSALDVLKAISGVQGFRGNQTAVENVKKSLPAITDTQDTAATKLSYIAQQVQDRENAILGTPGTVDTTNFVLRSEDQAKSALVDAAKTDTNVSQQITRVLGETNPDTGQPYTYLEAAQILGIDIPGIGPDPFSQAQALGLHPAE